MLNHEATYLAWIDMRETDVASDPVGFFEKAGVGVSNGSYFGIDGFVRLNFGCPR
jgi:cystathionine beta-lyase